VNKQKGVSSLLWIVIILSVVIVAGGIATWQMWPREEAPTPSSTADSASITTSTPSADETAVKEVVTEFLKAKQSRSFEEAKPFLTPEFAKTIDPVMFAGTSNPHMGQFEIQGIQLLSDGETYQVKARIYSEYTGQGVIGYQDNNYYLQPFDCSYRINRIEFGEYINLDETADWKTYTNEEYGFEFKYPEKIDTDYISIYSSSWPPETILTPIDPNFVCEENLNLKTALGYGKREEITVNDTTYCVTTGSEGTAGYVYMTYRYVTNKDNRQVTFEFTLAYPDCGALYGIDNKMEKCETEQDSFNPTILIDKIFSTFKFID